MKYRRAFGVVQLSRIKSVDIDQAFNVELHRSTQYCQKDREREQEVVCIQSDKRWVPDDELDPRLCRFSPMDAGYVDVRI